MRPDLRARGTRTRAGLIPTKRPPQPRLAEAEYSRFANAVADAWKLRARDWSDDPAPPSKGEILDYWAVLLNTFGLMRMLSRVSATIDRANSSYFRSLFKAVPPRADHTPIREQWIQENRKLWTNLGDELADRLLEVLRRARTDAAERADAKLTPAQKAELERIQSGAQFGGSQGATVTQRALERKGLIREGAAYPYRPELTEAGRAALGITPPPAPPATVKQTINQARQANVDLITGVTPAQRGALSKLLKAGQEQGVRHETLIEQVEAVTGYGKSRSRLIARDQAVKHNAAVQQAQAQAVGITKYRWRIVRDEATRPMHRALDGQVFSYNNPPVTNPQGEHNNPGGDYQCRCQAEAVIDLFAGLGDT